MNLPSLNVIHHNNRDADEYREIFNTNVVGTSNVTQALLPLLRKSNTRRIINISSDFGSITLIPPGVSTPSVCINMYNILKVKSEKGVLRNDLC